MPLPRASPEKGRGGFPSRTAAGRKRPLLVGLTGSIGMGKTETAKLFTRLGIPVYDADATVHRLYEKGGAAVEPVAAAFPGTVRDGRVDRAALSARLAGPAELARLEAIVHPLATMELEKFLAAAAKAGGKLVVLDIPLLFETEWHTRMDAVVVASAPEAVQRARVLARPGMDATKLDRLLDRQMDDAEKRAKAHFVVETGKGLDHAFEQVKQIVAALTAPEK